MNKAILVIDVPKSCNECPICASYAESAFSPREYWCTAADNTDVDQYDKPKWCPLKCVPKKRKEKYAADVGDRDCGFIDGWNACIDEILWQ